MDLQPRIIACEKSVDSVIADLDVTEEVAENPERNILIQRRCIAVGADLASVHELEKETEGCWIVVEVAEFLLGCLALTVGEAEGEEVTGGTEDVWVYGKDLFRTFWWTDVNFDHWCWVSRHLLVMNVILSQTPAYPKSSPATMIGSGGVLLTASGLGFGTGLRQTTSLTTWRQTEHLAPVRSSKFGVFGGSAQRNLYLTHGRICDCAIAGLHFSQYILCLQVAKYVLLPLSPQLPHLFHWFVAVTSGEAWSNGLPNVAVELVGDAIVMI